MSNDCRFKHYLKATGTEVTDLKISVYYSKGGINYFNYKQEPSAIWASISPVKREQRDGIGFEQFVLGKGIKVNFEAAERLNRKKVEAAFQRVLAEITLKTGRVWDAIQRVCAEEGVTLVEGEVHSPAVPTA